LAFFYIEELTMSKRYSLLLVLIPSLFYSCPSPLKSTMISRLNDSVAASIEIQSPADMNYYATWVEVTGRVTDSADDADSAGEVRSLSYEVLGTALGGTVSVEATGDFRFGFSALGFSTTLTIRLTAMDWNGNVSTKTLSLRKGSSDIPLLSVTPGNKEVTLSWEAIAAAQSYTLYYTDNGTPPSPGYGLTLAVATPPKTVSGLLNGRLYTFQLKADSEWGDEWDALSGYVQAIPVSLATLEPRVQGEFGKIRISWPVIPGTDKFEVLRAEPPYAEYLNISGLVLGNEYWDSTAMDGVNYYYKVKPYGVVSTPSQANCGQTSPFTKDRVLSLYNTPTYACSLALDGNYVYIADDDSIVALNVAKPDSPIFAGSITTPNMDHQHIAARSGYAYLADRLKGFTIFDFNTPVLPSLLSSLSMVAENGAYYIALTGNYAYVVTGSGKIIIINISNPSIPTVESTIALAGAINLTFAGDCAYVVDGRYLRIFNTSNPVAPVEIGSHDLTNQGYSVAISGHYAYVSYWDSNIAIVDISDPENPIRASTYTHTQNLDYSTLTIEGNALYVGIDYLVSKLDVSNPLSPVAIGEYETWDQISNLGVGDGIVYIAESELGLEVVTFGTPTARQVALADTPGFAQHVRVSGDHMLVADRYSGLCIMDISDPGAPAIEGTLWFSGAAFYALDLGGTNAYIVNGYEELIIVDWRVPSAPVISGRCPLSNPQDIFVYGDYAYIADDYNGLSVVDISDPANPFQIGTFVTGGSAGRVAAQGKYAYVLDYNTGLFVLDVGNPVSIKKTWQNVKTQGGLLQVKDDRLFAGYEYGGVDIYDISNPAAPVLLGTYHNPGFTDRLKELEVIGNYVFLVDRFKGLQILDITDPAVPVQVGSLDIPFVDDLSLAVQGRYAYLAEGNSGILVIDLYP
jgi:hypothetical protein